MFQVISDAMAQWYEMINAFLITMNFCTAKENNFFIDVYDQQSLWNKIS